MPITSKRLENKPRLPRRTSTPEPTGFGPNIRYHRNQKGVSLSVLARGSQISEHVICDIEEGHLMPFASDLVAIAHFLNLSIDLLVKPLTPDQAALPNPKKTGRSFDWSRMNSQGQLVR